MGSLIATQQYTQQLFYGFDRESIQQTCTYTNSSGSSVTIPAGRCMGQVLATGKWKLQDSTSTDGSEMPRGFNIDAVTVADGDSLNLEILTGGVVYEELLVFATGEDLDTVVRTVSTGGGTIGALLRANTTIFVMKSSEGTRFQS